MICKQIPLMAAVSFFGWSPLASGQEPVWWSESGTKIWQTSSVNASNHAPVNIGQLKNMAAKAKQHLDLKLASAGGAGSEITSMVNAFTTGPDNHAIANVGQVKAVAAPFYRRFAYPSVGFNAGAQLRQRMGLSNSQSSVTQGVEYPWVAPDDGSHHAPANIGQLKLVFGFDLAAWSGPTDADLDGWSDVFEISVQTNPLNATSIPGDDDDSDNDGVTNYWERVLGLNGGNSNSDGLGVPDGLEDTDLDGLTNHDDAHPASAVVAWRKSPESKYLVVPLALPAGVSEARGYDLNNSGHAVGLGLPSNTDSTRPKMMIPIVWQAGTAAALASGATDNTGWQSNRITPPTIIVSSPVRWFCANTSASSTAFFPPERTIYIDDTGLITADGFIQVNNQGQGWMDLPNGSATAMSWNSTVAAPRIIGRTIPFSSDYSGSRYDTRIISGRPLAGGTIIAEQLGNNWPAIKYSTAPFTGAPAFHPSGIAEFHYIEGAASDGYLTAQGRTEPIGPYQSFIWSSLTSGSPIAAVSPSSIGAVKAIARITNAPSSVHAAVGGGRPLESIVFGPGYAVIISNKSSTSPWTEALHLSRPAPHTPAGIVTRAFINSSGVVVWDSATAAAPYYSEPFLWRNGKSHRVQTLLTNQDHIIDRITALNDKGVMLANLKQNGSNPVRPALLLPVEVAPEVLAVNSNFDEGRIDPATGYAIPDCDDVPGVNPKTGAGNTLMALEAVRPQLDGTYSQYQRVTNNLHEGWFGVNPKAFGNDFWDGANVTIRKIDKVDDDTGHPQSGQVRFYAKWGEGTSQYRGIPAYDYATLTPVNLVTGGINAVPSESVYGSNSALPANTKFFIEGVRPGKITLEWRYVKGSIDFRCEQTFAVVTKKTRAEWLNEVYYQIRLQTKVATGSAVDVSTYHPGDGFYANVPNVQAIYYYYRQLFRQMPEKFMWAGMAKTAAAPIYAGMSDLTEWYYGSELTPGTGFGARDVGTGKFINGLLLDGQRHIFNDMAWSHRAYQASGIGAVRHSVEAGNLAPTISAAWNIIEEGIRDSVQTKINDGNGRLLRREQEIVVQPDYEFIRGVWLRQPPAIAAWWFDATLVPVNASGLANAAVWLTANSKKNPLNPSAPHSPSFLTTVPGGHLDVFVDRWAWTSNPTNGMLEIWTGSSTAGPNFDAAKRLLHAGKSMYSAAAVYSYDAAMLPNE